MKAVIVQPFYMPWIGYFGMIDAADVFVFADDVQFLEKSWQRRNKIKVFNEPKWISVPIEKNFGQNIDEAKINKSNLFKKQNWRENHRHLISLAYKKAAHYEDFIPDFNGLYDIDWDYLCDLNIYSAEKISKLLGLTKTKFIRKSELEGLDGRKVDSIISICDNIGADEYISGPAARNYIDSDEFKKLKESNIELYWFEFPHPVYPQIGDEFIPYLSVIDLMFNTGKKSVEYIKESVEKSLVLEDGSSLE